MAVVRDILSQEEITALLHGAGRVPAAPGAAVELFDFAADDHRARALLPRLDPIAKGFAARLQETLSKGLRCRVDVEAIAAACHISPAIALATMGPAPTGCIEVIDPPATLWVAVGSSWVTGMVDACYGGAGGATLENWNHANSSVAAWVLQRLLAWIRADLMAAWPATHPLQLAQTPTVQIRLGSVSKETDEHVVLQRFSLASEGNSADLALVMPIAICAGLAAPANPLDTLRQARWQRSMGQALREVPLTLAARLAETRLTVKELLALRVGDILPLEEPEQITLYLENHPLLQGEMGLAGGRKVVRCGGHADPLDTQG
ncbi:MAG TPA: FliM/FliN family flagellar motor switch protein [Candidatus Macondimonas sp.]|nr:FliM/FliN family flagellar motor switch protein [Candidatus Macondimonas sp.]